MTEVRKNGRTRGQDMKVLFEGSNGVMGPVSRRVPLQAHPGRRKVQKCGVLIQDEWNRIKLHPVIQFMQIRRAEQDAICFKQQFKIIAGIVTDEHHDFVRMTAKIECQPIAVFLVHDNVIEFNLIVFPVQQFLECDMDDGFPP